MVGGVTQPLSISPFALIMRRLKIAGSIIGGIKGTQEMLDFCSKNNIGCTIEKVDATPEAVNAAYGRTHKSDVKFRFVIETGKTLVQKWIEG